MRLLNFRLLPLSRLETGDWTWKETMHFEKIVYIPRDFKIYLPPPRNEISILFPDPPPFIKIMNPRN